MIISAIRDKHKCSQKLMRHTSVSEEAWGTNGKDLLDLEFEQILKQRAETARTISSASFIPNRE